jgi:hypothetical protein
VYIVFVPYSPSYTLSPLLPPTMVPSTPPPHIRPVLPSRSPVLQKKKKRHFCLFKIATWGVSVWHFHVYRYYNPNWFISSILLFSALLPFLWWL